MLSFFLNTVTKICLLKDLSEKWHIAVESLVMGRNFKEEKYLLKQLLSS